MRKSQRQILYARDVENIMGCSVRTAYRMMEKVRIAVGKEVGSYITVHEFCEVLGVEEDFVRESLG